MPIVADGINPAPLRTEISNLFQRFPVSPDPRPPARLDGRRIRGV